MVIDGENPGPGVSLDDVLHGFNLTKNNKTAPC